MSEKEIHERAKELFRERTALQRRIRDDTEEVRRLELSITDCELQLGYLKMKANRKVVA